MPFFSKYKSCPEKGSFFFDFCSRFAESCDLVYLYPFSLSVSIAILFDYC